MLQKLRATPLRENCQSLTEVHNLLHECSKREYEVELVWVPGQSGVEENDEADAANHWRRLHPYRSKNCKSCNQGNVQETVERVLP